MSRDMTDEEVQAAKADWARDQARKLRDAADRVERGEVIASGFVLIKTDWDVVLQCGGLEIGAYHALSSALLRLSDVAVKNVWPDDRSRYSTVDFSVPYTSKDQT